MIRYEDECVGCPSEMGCMGSACPNRNVPHIYCDVCGEELDSDDRGWDLYSDYHECANCRGDEDEE